MVKRTTIEYFDGTREVLQDEWSPFGYHKEKSHNVQVDPSTGEAIVSKHEVYHGGIIPGTVSKTETTTSRSLRPVKSIKVEESSSGCYLTTACVEAMGLPDDCFELETLRWFRDNTMIGTHKGKKAIADYGVIAPEIVQAADETEGVNADKIWRSIYKDITKAVNMVIRGDFEEAFRHYQQMTSRLKAKYLD